MPAKASRVGRPRPRGPRSDQLWQPPPRPVTVAASAPESEPEPASPQGRRRLVRRSLRPDADTPDGRAD